MSTLCGKGKHPRTPENRTRTDLCKLCASELRQDLIERNRQSKRAQREREQTAKNMLLRDRKSTSDDTPQEHARASRIFALMDALETAPTARDRMSIQQQINKLTGGKPK